MSKIDDRVPRNTRVKKHTSTLGFIPLGIGVYLENNSPLSFSGNFIR
jgi:hypothetical protein